MSVCEVLTAADWKPGGRKVVEALRNLTRAEHAYVRDGQIYVLFAGRMTPMSGWDATMILMSLDGSPYPESQERARQIRAALKETMQ